MAGDRTQGFFDEYAGHFDAIYGTGAGPLNGILNRLFRRSMKLRFIKTMEGCRPIEGKTVLDIGCGPGHYSISLARAGAARTVGLDFADGMLRLAADHARQGGVEGRCEFRNADFLQYTPSEPFDYVIVMGFMDYMSDPMAVIRKVLSLTRHRAFFSFPAAGGILAWQRRMRYRNRCDLFLYRRHDIQRLFAAFPEVHVDITPAARDYFVTAEKAGG
ncbi:MAG TPA: class I SAM-dependent methyltransferase [Bryobacteraceae bacterium]|nr:class I SAM-dependent methyltransferase [Bryobacteraceae bacterium]